MNFLRLINLQGWLGLVGSALLAALLVVQVGKTHHEHSASVGWEHKYEGEHSAFLQTIINYSNAAEKAREADAANVARVAREAAAVSQERDQSYEARIADARARSERLRQDATSAAHQGRAGATPVSGVPGPAGSPNGPAAEAGLPPSDALTATEQAIQLDELERWVRGILGLDTTGLRNP